MKTPAAVFASLALLAAVAQLRAADDATPAPKPIDPKQIEASLVPEKNEILAGEPIYVTFMLTNKSGRDLGVYLGDELYYNDPANPSDYFRFKITDSNGKEVPIIPGRGPGLSIFDIPVECKFPAGGEYGVPLFLPMRAVLDKPGDYTISVTKTANFSVTDSKRLDFFNSSQAALTVEKTATATIKVMPPDPGKMGQLIDDLGEKMVAYGKNSSQSDASRKDYDEDWNHGGLKAGEGYTMVTEFMQLQDDRMIPFLLRAAVGSINWPVRMAAFNKLATFDSDAAFNALKTAMATPADKVADAPFESYSMDKSQSKPTPAELFRQEAFSAITNSKNPGAVAYALPFRHDPDAHMRVQVESMVCERMKPEEAFPLLKEFAADTDPGISREARATLCGICGQIKPEEAIPELRELAKDSDPQISAAAKDALAAAKRKLIEQTQIQRYELDNNN